MGSPRRPQLHPRVKVGTEAAGDRGSSAEPPGLCVSPRRSELRLQAPDPAHGSFLWGRPGRCRDSVLGLTAWPASCVIHASVCGHSASGNSTASISSPSFPDSVGYVSGILPLVQTSSFFFQLLWWHVASDL